MTREQFAARLALLTDEALTSADLDVAKASIVLCAILGFFTEPIEPDDRRSLDHLAIIAGKICEHRTGKHGKYYQ